MVPWVNTESIVEFKVAARTGDLATVARMMDAGEVDPSVCDDYAIKWAARNGHARVVGRLLRDKRTNPFNGLAPAAETGQADIVRNLLANPRCQAYKDYFPRMYDFTSDFPNHDKPIYAAVARGNVEIVKMLLPYGIRHPGVVTMNATFNSNGGQFVNEDVIDLLKETPYLKNARYMSKYDDPNQIEIKNHVREYRGFIAAVRNGDHVAVARMIDEGDVDPAMLGSHIINLAAANGHINVVRVLLNNARIEFDSFIGIKLAANNGHVDIVDMLLGVFRGNWDHVHVSFAAECGHADVIDRMLMHTNVIVTSGDIDKALTKGHVDIARTLHNLSGLLPTDDGFRGAATRGHVDAVDWIISKFPHIDVAKDRSECYCPEDAADSRDHVIVAAAKAGHVGVIERLLMDPALCIVPDDDDIYAICYYNKGDPRFDRVAQHVIRNFTDTEQISLRYFSSVGNVGMVDYLLQRVSFTEFSLGFAVSAAISYDQPETLDRLLQSGQFRNSDISLEEKFWYVTHRANVDILHVLLRNRRFDITKCRSKDVGLIDNLKTLYGVDAALVENENTKAWVESRVMRVASACEFIWIM